MPVIQVNLLEGRNEQQKQEFIEEVTDLAEDVLDARRKGVRVLFYEVAPTDWGIAGQSVKQKNLTEHSEADS